MGIERAAACIREARDVVGFTGAGISVESGIPPFRGPGGLWNKYDPKFLELDYFLRRPEQAWELIREIFYEFFGKAEPNAAHRALATLEQAGKLSAVITQNIDDLHQQAGSKVVHEYHGTAQFLLCLDCGERPAVRTVSLETVPPRCPCGGLYKPDFIFFGEAIPQTAAEASLASANHCDVMLVIGTSGEVMPACALPYAASENGATVIEVNLDRSSYTERVTDIYLEGQATEVLGSLLGALAL